MPLELFNVGEPIVDIKAPSDVEIGERVGQAIDRVDRAQQAVPGAQAAGHQLQRVVELVGERRLAPLGPGSRLVAATYDAAMPVKKVVVVGDLGAGG